MEISQEVPTGMEDIAEALVNSQDYFEYVLSQFEILLRNTPQKSQSQIFELIDTIKQSFNWEGYSNNTEKAYTVSIAFYNLLVADSRYGIHLASSPELSEENMLKEIDNMIRPFLEYAKEKGDI